MLEAINEFGPLRKRDLIEILVIAESGDEPHSKIRPSVKSGVYQDHTPQMLKFDVVEQEGTGPIGPGPNFEAVVALIDDAREHFDVDNRTRTSYQGGNIPEIRRVIES